MLDIISNIIFYFMHTNLITAPIAEQVYYMLHDLTQRIP